MGVSEGTWGCQNYTYDIVTEDMPNNIRETPEGSALEKEGVPGSDQSN